MKLIFALLPVLLSTGSAAGAYAPSGLLCDFQKHPALGVRATPHFTWIVPPCAGASDQMQTAFQIIVTSIEGAQIWDSGKQESNESTYVAYGGPALNASTTYQWSVSTWTDACQSAPSDPAAFTTALFNGWLPSAQFISTSASCTFGYFRKEVTVPANVVSAVAHVTALVDDKLLSGYKLYINDALINLGPARGEAPVWADAPNPGLFRNLPYTTLDVTHAFTVPGQSVVALQTMHKTPSTIMQLTLRLAGGAELTVVTDSTWLAFNGDVHRQPGPARHGGSAGTGFLEYIDARFEPVGWRAPGFTPTASWVRATPFLQNVVKHN